MKYIYIIEIIVFSIIAFFSSNFIMKYSNNMSYSILNYLCWGSIILVSMLLNLNKYLYSFSVLVISIIIICAYIYNKIVVESRYTVIFWMYIFSTIFTLICIILTKKYIYTAINSNPQQGDKGRSGDIGYSGNSYFLETYPEKCYNDIITGFEDKYRLYKDEKKIDYNKNEMQFKNRYLKNHIRNVCKSNKFLDFIYSNSSDNISCKHTNVKKPHSHPNSVTNNHDNNHSYNENRCDNSEQNCINDDNCNPTTQTTQTTNTSEELYSKKMEEIKEVIITDTDSWFNTILKHSLGEKFLENEFELHTFFDKLTFRINNGCPNTTTQSTDSNESNPIKLLENDNDNIWNWTKPQIKTTPVVTTHMNQNTKCQINSVTEPPITTSTTTKMYKKYYGSFII
jgi:hypothetical protein